MKLTNRLVEKDDLSYICKLPEDKEMLFFMFPTATFPLTVDQLNNNVQNRFENTVFEIENTIVGFANLYFSSKDKKLYIGNVVLAKEYRYKGYGKEIMKIMIDKAKFHSRTLNLIVFKDNNQVHDLYRLLGFKDIAEDSMEDYNKIHREFFHMELFLN